MANCGNGRQSPLLTTHPGVANNGYRLDKTTSRFAICPGGNRLLLAGRCPGLLQGIGQGAAAAMLAEIAVRRTTAAYELASKGHISDNMILGHRLARSLEINTPAVLPKSAGNTAQGLPEKYARRPALDVVLRAGAVMGTGGDQRWFT